MGWLNNMFHKILLLIDGAVYWAVSQVYQIFIKLADARIFQDAFFSNFAKRVYAIIGVVMLFYLAYALLTSLVDPDKATNGDKSLTKIAQNIVISLVILGILPTIFDYAYRLQGILFKENAIGAIIFGTDSVDSDSIDIYGNYMAFTALNPFLNPENYNVRLTNNYSWFDLKADLIDKGDFKKITRMSDWAIEAQPLISEATIGKDDNGDPIILSTRTDVELTYTPIISTIVGAVLLYLIASFCLDLGIRIVKFAFCQLIAPIPIVMRIIPSKKGTFDKWLKLTLSTYFEVFIRVGLMYLVIYFFSEIGSLDMFKYATSGIQGLIVLAIILMGLLAFAKQAPKMISEILGLDSGNLKLGIKDKLKAGGFFAAGTAAGALVASHGNPFATIRGWKKGMKDGDFKGIGQEANLRQQVLKAKENGSTWTSRRVDDIRRTFGLGTQAERLDRNIEREFNDYVVDGTHYTKQQIEERKFTIKSKSEANKEDIRNFKRQVDNNQRIVSTEKEIRDLATSRIERIDANEVNKTIQLAPGEKNYGTFTGNYYQISNWIDQLEKSMTPKKPEVPPPPVAPKREDFSQTVNGRTYFNQAAYNQAKAQFAKAQAEYVDAKKSESEFENAVKEHAEIISNYRMKLAQLKDEMSNDYIDRVMNPADALKFDGISTKVDKLNVDLASMGRTRVTNSTELDTTKKTLQSQNNTLNSRIHSIELDEEINTDNLAKIDRVEALQKQRVETYKQTNGYRAASANRDIGKKG